MYIRSSLQYKQQNTGLLFTQSTMPEFLPSIQLIHLFSVQLKLVSRSEFNVQNEILNRRDVFCW